MHMTRQRAKSSFTVEIKRAGRRSAAAHGATKAILGLDLLEHTFGAPSRAGAPLPRATELEDAPHSRASDALYRGPKPVHDDAKARSEPHARRILPDLLARAADPLQERMEREAEERAARRRARADSSRRDAEAVPDGKPEGEITRTVSAAAAEPVAEITRTVLAAPAEPVLPSSPEQPISSAADEADESQGAASSERQSPGRSARRAQRAGRADGLRRGERWKRRLPDVCW
jgi:hypothetical protein